VIKANFHESVSLTGASDTTRRNHHQTDPGARNLLGDAATCSSCRRGPSTDARCKDRSWRRKEIHSASSTAQTPPARPHRARDLRPEHPQAAPPRHSDGDGRGTTRVTTSVRSGDFRGRSDMRFIHSLLTATSCAGVQPRGPRMIERIERMARGDGMSGPPDGAKPREGSSVRSETCPARAHEPEGKSTRPSSFFVF